MGEDWKMEKLKTGKNNRKLSIYFFIEQILNFVGKKDEQKLLGKKFSFPIRIPL